MKYFLIIGMMMLILVAGCINVNTGTKIGLISGDISGVNPGQKEIPCNTVEQCNENGIPESAEIQCVNKRCFSK